jgi:exopolysaccharide biosynthesis polyprenyl glycosylphosphotransferase
MIRLFQVFFPTGVFALLVSELVLCTACYVMATFIVYTPFWDVYLIDEMGWVTLVPVVLTVVLTFYYQDMYMNLRIRSRTLLLQQLSLAIGMALLVQSLLNYGRTDLMMHRQIMLTGSILSVAVLGSYRMIYASHVIEMLGRQRVLLVGRSAVLEEVARRMSERMELGMRVVGFVDDERGTGELEGAPWLGPIAEVRRVVEETKPDRVVVNRWSPLPMMELLDLRFQGLAIETPATAYETVFGRLSIRELQPADLVFSSELRPSPAVMGIQQAYSWVLALVGLVIVFPVMVAVALAVKLSSRGPVFYRQTRVGLNGKNFTLYKFRSMGVNAEQGTGAVWATKNDPRVTPLGKWLRKLRLDELPQLFNVLKREMTMVGPRPERPEFVKMLSEQIPYYRQRHYVKPGITGWAQINHKYGDTMEDTEKKLEYDLYYIKRQSLVLDLYIMFQTVKVMLLSRGAQ